jgi:hypothetical protein
MDRRFESWNVRSLHRAISLRTVATEIAKSKLILWDYDSSDGTKVALNWQVLTFSSNLISFLLLSKHVKIKYTILLFCL